jgi:hypothetical protein
MRPLVHPALVRAWRDSGTVQIGLDPAQAVVLAGLCPAEVAVIARMNGVWDVGSLRAVAEQNGGSASTADRMIEILDTAGLLVDGDHSRPDGPDDALGPDRASASLLRRDGGQTDPLADRRRAYVEVRGAGRVGAVIARLLAAAGVGCVSVEDDGRATARDIAPGGLTAADLGRPRGLAVSAALPDLPARPGDRPDMVVLAPTGHGARHDAADLVRFGIAHLIARVIETTGVVGPLVLPGTTSCLRCHDLHRTDRDPAWPRVIAQADGAPAGTAACDVTLATSVAAIAAQQALAHLDGFVPTTVDGTVEISLPAGLPRRRSWQPHPACGCTWAA